MENLIKTELLIRVAKLYYEDNLSQSEIAKILGFSRPHISKLIGDARALGIVNIQIHDSLQTESSLERKIRLRFNLLRVFAVSYKPNEQVHTKVGVLGAKYLNSIVKPGDIVCVGGGNTVYHCANHMAQRDDLDNMTVVQMDGSMISLKHDMYTQHSPKLIADAWGGTPLFFPVPFIVCNEEIKNALFRDENIAAVAKKQDEATIALFTVGGTGMGRSMSAVQSNFLLPEQIEKMIQQGLVGNIGGHFLAKDGSILDSELDKRVLSLQLGKLRRKPYRICLAAGRSKYEAVYAALTAGIINVLIVDMDMAKAISIMI